MESVLLLVLLGVVLLAMLTLIGLVSRTSNPSTGTSPGLVRPRSSSPGPVSAQEDDDLGAPEYESRPGSPYRHRLEPLDGGDAGRGYVVVRNEGGQVLNWRTLPRRKGLRSLNVVGESRRMEALQQEAFAPGQSLRLLRDPENEYDENAVEVCDASGEHQVGWIPRPENRPVAKKLDDGEELRCYSMWEIWRDGQRVSLRVLICDENARLAPPLTRGGGKR